MIQSLINENDEIELNRNFTYGIGDSLTEGISINKSVAIDGNGHTIDANHQARIFKVTSGTVTLKNINFINGYADSGAAMYCEDANLTVIGCNFSDNVAYDDNSCGGAIVFNGDKLNVDSSRFTSNEAENGGAIIIEAATLAELVNVQFSENGAYDYGALGIFAGNALIDYCTFDSNYANRSVGAVYSTANVKVNNTVFKANRANASGVLFYSGYGDDSLIIDCCQFIDNDCCAVYLYSYHARILNSQFTNSTSDRGYAIYNGALNELYLSNNTLSTDRVEIFSAYAGNISSQVTATILGNRTVYKHLNEKVLVYLTFFDDNGNLMQVQDFDLLINSTKIYYIYNNLTQRYEANFTADELGLYPVTIADTYLSDLTIKNGEIHIVDVSNDFSTLQMLIDNSTGALALARDYVFNPLTDIDLVGGIVIGRDIEIGGAGFTLDAKNQARIFHVVSGSAAIKNITFTNANASYGASIWVEGGNLNVDSSNFINGSADSGNAIRIGVNAALTLSNSTFKGDCLNRRTIDNYGILCLYNNAISSKSTEILNNGGKIISPCTATVKAGTTFVYGDKTKFTAVIADDNGNLIGDAYHVYFNVGGKLIESAYDSTAGEYVAEYVFGSAGLIKVVVSCRDINITDNRGVDITVLKQNAAITAKDASYIINYGGKYSLTLKGSNGKAVAGEKVTFMLNGKAIGSATTNAKGTATITLTAKILKTAKAGKKNLVIRLASNNYNAAAKTVKIAINKEKTKIAAKNKAFKKSQKTKKYVMTLKNSKGKAIKGVKLTLKVKGKTYTAKTNAKGKATFKITKLAKKGKFKATLKFKGNAYYNAVTKNVKITIR